MALLANASFILYYIIRMITPIVTIQAQKKTISLETVFTMILLREPLSEAVVLAVDLLDRIGVTADVVRMIDLQEVSVAAF